MASLPKTQRIFSSIDYVGNFMNEPVKLGNIYQRDDHSFVLLANIIDFVPGLKLADITDVGPKMDMKFTKESGVEVKFGASGDVKLAKGEVELNFKRKNSAFVALKDATVSLLRVASIKKDIQKIWQDNGYKRNGRFVFVNQLVMAASGTVVFSQESNNRVVLKATTDEAAKTIASLGSGNFEFVINSKATLEIISPNSILPMFKGSFFRPNGNVEVL